MTAELLVLQFVDDGKLSVNDALQLLETLAVLEDEREESSDDSPTPLTIWIFPTN